MSEELSFDCQPHNTNKAIQSVYTELLSSDDKLTLRPSYQRNKVWVNEQKSYLIDTIMTRCPMPIFLLYMCDENEEYECIDGQNRLASIKEYIEQDTNPFAWIIENDDGSEYVYYDNENTRDKLQQFCDIQNKRKHTKQIKHRLMTQSEVKRFKKYELTLSQIKTSLTFNQRKQIFMRWQNGTSISQCDGFKNECYPYCEYVIENSLNRELTDKISCFLKSDNRNWLWDIYRLLNVFQKDKLNDVIISTIQTRTHIQYDTSMQFKENQLKLENILHKLIPLHPFKKSMYLSFILGYIFIWRKETPDVQFIAEKEEFIIEFAKESLGKEEHNHSTLNNGPNVKSFISTFEDFKKVFYKCIDKYTLVKRKKTIPAVLKRDLWEKYIGVEKGLGDCYCCRKKNNISKDEFHAGHVIPEINGGQTTVENLRPICSLCNYSMGVQNMEVFKQKHYPT